MPPPVTREQFVAQARRSGAAAETDLDRFQAAWPVDAPGTALAAAEAMVGHGLITPYQAERLLRGDGRGLRITGRYRVLDRLGGGGMGHVYLCRDADTGSAVAVKVLPAALSRDPEAVARFEREARAAAVLNHPVVVRALDVGQDGWHPFLVLEFVDGTDLYRFVSVRGPLDPRAAAHYIARAADGLQRAFELGWVHRDVKPHNLMVDRAGHVRLLDLGLARPVVADSANVPVTTQGGGPTLLGTADFIAPEQAIDSSNVDGRADIYSLGATLYFLLAGRPPFPDGTVAEKLTWHRHRTPEPIEVVRPDVPPGLARVVVKMMAKEPGDRYRTPAEVAAALAEWADPPPAPAALPDWPLAVRRLVGLPGVEAPVVQPPVAPGLPSSFPDRASKRPAHASWSGSRWAVIASISAGLAAGAVFGARTISGAGSPVPAVSSAGDSPVIRTPSCGATGTDAPRSITGRGD